MISIDPATGATGGVLSTLSEVTCVRMSASNRSLLVAARGDVLDVVRPGGCVTLNWRVGWIDEMELDGDNEWICGGFLANHRLFTMHDVWGIPGPVTARGGRGTINIPPGIPRGLGVTVFVSGVILGGGQPPYALNTHWFRL